MSEVTQEQSPEDLSQLKSPSPWWSVIMFVSATAIAAGFWYYDTGDIPSLGAVLLLIISMTGVFVVGLVGWFEFNQIGHPVRWWKDGDQLRVTAREEYPKQATRLVIDVQVKARPSCKLRWGEKGWYCVSIDHEGWAINLRGERLQLVHSSQAALSSDGLDVVVVDFLVNAGQRWKIIPLDAGRVLRFVDRLGCGMEMRFDQFDGVDLEEILRFQNCADYHRRMQEKVRDYAEAYRLMYEVLKAIGIPSPIYDETLAVRLGQVKEASARLRAKLEDAWAELRLVLNSLILEMESAGRPKAKLAVARRVELLMKFLHKHLPADHSLRAGNNISQEALDEMARLIAAEEAKLAPPAGPPGGMGDEA